MGNINWGDAPTWIAGLFAATAAYYTRGMLRSQQQQIKEQREFIAEQSANLALEREALKAAAAERREEQARQVRATEVNGQAVVRNESSAPVRDVTCQSGDAQSLVAHLAEIEEVDRHFNYAMSRSAVEECPLGSLAPGFLATFSGHVEGDPFVVEFTDDAGLRWRLDQHSVLRPVDE